MGKKLAIKGHLTRGKEVIELLEMLGGKISNECTYESGFDTDYFFFICEEEKNLIDGISYKDEELLSNYICFTLEEFLEKYPFKVGDKVTALFQSDKTATNGFCSMATVTIKSMSWSKDCETMMYDFEDTEVVLCAEDIESVNDTDNNHAEPSKMKNVLAELLEHIKTTPKEDLEREFEEIAEWSNVGPTIEEFRTFCECVNKKPVYPDNYEDCVRIAKKIHGYDINIDAPAYREEAESFIKLLICRDAYWKIYGEEMRLGKPWKPDWLDETTKYGIHVYQNSVIKDNFIRTNCVLVFPTPELQDAFYENFKDLIKECKDLL